MQLTVTTANKYKLELIAKQNGLCALCGEKLDLTDTLSIHLDHDHTTGHCRGVLHRACNTFEGMVLHKFSRSGLKSEYDYINWLKKLIVYLEGDYTSNPLHPGHLTVQVKQFKQLSKPDQLAILKNLGVEVPEKSTKPVLEKLYRKSITPKKVRKK